MIVMLIWGLQITTAAFAADSESIPSQPVLNTPFLLGPPQESGPVVVSTRFDLQDINEINDGAESFEFSGVFTLQWQDQRQAFDPEIAGVEEKVFQGGYQVSELAAGWFPQLVLVNESGLFQQSGVVLRIQPDGTSTLVQTLNASAKAELNMIQFPFDSHRLEAVFEVLGFDLDEIQLQAESLPAGPKTNRIQIPEWSVTGVSTSIRERPSEYAGNRHLSSAFVLSVDVERQPYYTLRLVVLPLIIIVLLSFSVFWMDRSSMGDRLNVSFIGILTGVAYLIVTSDHLPPISYFTLMYGFLNLSFLAMCATVLVTLRVAVLDKQSRGEPGDRLDHRCRWGFPIVYFGLLLLMLGAAFLLF